MKWKLFRGVPNPRVDGRPNGGRWVPAGEVESDVFPAAELEKLAKMPGTNCVKAVSDAGQVDIRRNYRAEQRPVQQEGTT